MPPALSLTTRPASFSKGLGQDLWYVEGYLLLVSCYMAVG
jgi:hypothetical protein